jgi:hypothetical protein
MNAAKDQISYLRFCKFLPKGKRLKEPGIVAYRRSYERLVRNRRRRRNYEALTESIAEIFLQHIGLVLPAYVAITSAGNIILRPIGEGHDGHDGVALN